MALSIDTHMDMFGEAVTWARAMPHVDESGGYGDATWPALSVPDSAAILHDDGPIMAEVPGGVYAARAGTVVVRPETAAVLRIGDRLTDGDGRRWRLTGAPRRFRLFDAYEYPCETDPVEAAE